MNSIDTIREFLGWCSVVNIFFLMAGAVVVIVAGSPIKRLHSTMFGVREEDLPQAYFQFLANLEVAVVVFNIAPYLALCLMD